MSSGPLLRRLTKLLKVAAAELRNFDETFNIYEFSQKLLPYMALEPMYRGYFSVYYSDNFLKEIFIRLKGSKI